MTIRDDIAKAIADMDVVTRYRMIIKLRGNIFLHRGTKNYRKNIASENSRAAARLLHHGDESDE